MGARFHRLFGLTFESALAIPWAPEAEAGAAADVRIRLGPPSTAEPPGRGTNALQFDVPQIGRYLVSHGRDILVSPFEGARAEDIRLYLLGSALGVLLHQRGLLVLHANAIVIDGGAALFMGPSGAGKSTLAGWFSTQGFPVLTDDICAVRLAADDPAMVLPGLTRLRLSPEAAGHLAIPTSEGESCPTSGKHELAIDRDQRSVPVPLRACFLLSEAPGDGPAQITRLAGLDAVQMLVANTYRGFAVQRLGGGGDHLAACARVAATIPCFEARRPKRWDRFDATAHALLDRVRSLT